ncbi:hypothetical protein RHMOL_Rhmol03G0002000 [Rhododendron molle]|uniref:Uncharacterized protein n=1 Tax=Rhododendron molle TaxID=49168 RepID=A0ACC0PBC4_RHOML|nr:hypothetical protein RHMOL_Rhmol03G0002000 [Rhododendron molle]
MTEPESGQSSKNSTPREARRGGGGVGKAFVVMICGSLVYYHCAYRNSSIVSLVSDVFIVLLCSLAILGLLFRHIKIEVPVDPLEWQISQDTANSMFACLANTIGAAESVLRVAATGHDKRLFLKVGCTMRFRDMHKVESLTFQTVGCSCGCESVRSVCCGKIGLWCYSGLCWIVLVLSLRACRELRVEQFMYATVPEEERPYGSCAG